MTSGTHRREKAQTETAINQDGRDREERVAARYSGVTTIASDRLNGLPGAVAMQRE